MDRTSSLLRSKYPHIPRILRVPWYLKYMYGSYLCYRLSCMLPCVYVALCLACFGLLVKKKTFVCQPQENSLKMLCSLSSTKTPRRMLTLASWINPNTNLDSSLQKTQVMADFNAKVFPRIPRKKKLYSPRRLQLEQEDEGYTNMSNYSIKSCWPC
jgi:hypothetical protein